MSNKYPVQVRMREMSKQEEILLKRKREIERKMKEQQGGSAKTSTSTTTTTTTTTTSKPTSGPTPPKRSSFTPRVPSTSSGSRIGQMPNKFHNDGSFLEQFKKLSKTEPEVKEEKPIFSDMFPSMKVELVPKIQMLNQVPPPTFPSRPTIFTPDLQKVKAENKMEKEQCEEEEKLRPEGEPDWFKEALKRAQAKAKELLETPPVSLSACPASASPESPPVVNKKKRSRWGETGDNSPPAAPPSPPPPPPPPPPPQIPPPAVSVGGPICLNVPENLMEMVGEGEHMQAIQGVMVTRLTRNNPAIVSYAYKVFGSLDLTDAQWRQCEDQIKMNVVYQLLQAKQLEADRLEQQGKVKYEYDSDEDVDGGTWEHKRRAVEMLETQAKAVELTSQAEGKHHIGDFLPPDELARFMEKYQAIQEGRDPDLSDYQEHKLTEENVGYRMLKSMGWTEGMGLGAEGKGITQPVNQNGRSESQALGVDRPDSLGDEDDEYDAYRKRMMLAYRFRPNPLNNPRRAYY